MVVFRLPRFIRRMIRRRMRPMTEEGAWSVKDKLSIAYALIAWNGFGVVCYYMYNGKLHWPVAAGLRSPEEEDIRPAIQFAHTLGMKKATVYRLSGMHISERTDFEVADENPVSPAVPVMVGNDVPAQNQSESEVD